MTHQRRNTLLAAGVSLVALVLIAVSFTINGSPLTRRSLRFDTERTQRLQRIMDIIDQPFREATPDVASRTLPAALDDLLLRPDSMLAATSLRDPETNAPFEYRVLDATHYELCATFGLASRPGDTAPVWRSDAMTPDFWLHGAGRTCYRFDVKDVTSAKPLAPPPVTPPALPPEMQRDVPPVEPSL